MVKILSSGEIVPDEDPRAGRSQGQRSGGEAGEDGPRRGHIHQGNFNDGEPVPHGPTGSVFDSLNQRLLDAGVPRWNAGPYPVEPIVSLGFLIAFLLMGFRGLLFGGLLFLVVKWGGGGGGGGGAGGNTGAGFTGWRGRGGQGGNTDPGAGNSGGGGASRGWSGGGGQRLGRS